ncbi:MAG: hypothetical protein CO093_01110 [Alphaproteobacteria bacterium CG_4_9_14_3_um_filter_47_13]|nr:MAG: hypothetical protein CO093_01110 [Alphaproteobacteria bacterium CG_4_9_14_3_um_filter_47_13]
MKPVHFATNFAAPVFFFLGIVLYAFAAVSIFTAVMNDINYLTVGFITFVLAYNCWSFGKSAKNATS